ALRRQQARLDSTLADPPLLEPPPDETAPRQLVDRDSSPRLPNAPEAKPRLLDTTPSPRTESPALKQNIDGATTKLGMEPARVDTGPSRSGQTMPPASPGRSPTPSTPPATRERAASP